LNCGNEFSLQRAGAKRTDRRVVTGPIAGCTPPHPGSNTAAEKIIIERLKYESLTRLAP